VGNLGLAGGADRVRAGCAGVFLDDWTQWAGNYNVLFQLGWIVTVPGLLLTMVGSGVFGVTLLVRGSAPRLPALLLALVIPLAWLIWQATPWAMRCSRCRSPSGSSGVGWLRVLRLRTSQPPRLPAR
jgi:hypothetical protein